MAHVHCTNAKDIKRYIVKSTLPSHSYLQFSDFPTQKQPVFSFFSILTGIFLCPWKHIALCIKFWGLFLPTNGNTLKVLFCILLFKVNIFGYFPISTC